MKNKFIYNQNFIKELSVKEHIILWVSVALSLGLFIAQLVCVDNAYKDWTTYVATFSTIVSVFSIMAGIKKKILYLYLGIVANLLLICINWWFYNYGSMITYIFNLVIQVISLFTWGKNNKTGVIQPKKDKWWFILVYLLSFLLLAALFTWLFGLEGFSKFWSGDPQTKPKQLVLRIFDALALVYILAVCYPMITKKEWVWYPYVIVSSSMIVLWILELCMRPLNLKDKLQAYTLIINSTDMLICNILGILNWKTNKKQSTK